MPLTNCFKWKLYKHEVEFTGSQLFSKTHNITFNSGEYIISRRTQSIHVCVPDDLRPELSYYIDIYYIISSWISVVSLIIAICLLWIKPRKNYAARTPMFCHMVTLILFFVVSEVYMTVPLSSGTECDLVLYSSFIMQRAAFCWLNVVMFNMWRKFRPSTIFVTVNNQISWKVFILQILYAWGLNIVIVGAVHFFKENTPGVDEDVDGKKCQIRFLTRHDKLMALTDVTSVLPLIANVIFAVLTIVNVRKISKEVAVCNENAPSELLSINVKIIVMTGIAWIVRSVQWMTIPFLYKPPLYWIIPDVLTPLQGVLLLVIFSCSFFNCKKKMQSCNTRTQS